MDIVARKFCNTCGEWKNKSEFHKCKQSPDGLRWICKSCRKIQERKYLTEEVRERTRTRAREWYRNNTDKAKEYVYKWVSENRDKVNLKNRIWRANHLESVIAKNHRYAKNNPDKILEKLHRRIAKKHNVSGGHFTEAEWRELLDRYDHKCLSCGRSDVPLERDHVVPIGPPHSDEIANIQPLCRSCNARKGNRIIDYR